MRKVTSYTVYETSVGTKVAITYSEIDEEGNITKENERIGKIVLDEEIKKSMENVKNFSQNIVDEI